MKLLLLLILGMNLLVACNKASDTSLSETFGVETPAPATTEEEPEPEPEEEVGSEYNAAGASLSAISGCPQSVLISSAGNSSVKILSLNSLNQPINNQVINFSVSGTSVGTISSGSATTDPDGIAEITFTTAATAGSMVINANSISGSVNCPITVFENAPTPSNLNAGGASLNLVLGCPLNIRAGGTSSVPFQVLALNSASDPINAQTVSFNIAGAASLTLSQASDSTDASGLAETIISAGATAGSATVTATSLQGSVTCNVTVTGLNTYTIARSSPGTTQNQTGFVSQDLANAFKVLVTDGSVPTPGVVVRFSVATGNGDFNGDPYVLATTDSNGIATAPSVLTLGPISGAQTVTASLHGDSSVSTTFTATANESWDIGTSTVTGASSSLTALGAGGTNTTLITLTLKDGSSANVASAVEQTVTFSTTLGAMTGSVVDNGDGTYSQLYRTSSTTGTATITAVVAGATVVDTHVVTVTHGSPSAAQSTFTATTLNLPPNGTSTSGLTITVKDAVGNLVTTGSPTVAVDRTGTGTLGSVVNNNNGTYSAIFTSPASTGSASVTATVNGTQVGSALNFVFANLAGTTLTCAAGDYNTWNGRDIYVASGTLKIHTMPNGVKNCTYTFNSVVIGPGGNITVDTGTDSTVYGLNFNVTGTLEIQASGSIDLLGKGNRGSSSALTTSPGYARYKWNEVSPTAQYSSGSFATMGYQWSGTSLYPPNQKIGTPENPTYPGSGGGCSVAPPSNCGSEISADGGGYLEISVGSLIVNGSINANGKNGAASGGSGGGIKITLGQSGTLTGSGTITANGAVSIPYNTHLGGAGRIAIYGGSSITFLYNNIQAIDLNITAASKLRGTIYIESSNFTGTQTLNQGVVYNFLDRTYTTDVSNWPFDDNVDLTFSGSTFTLDYPIEVKSFTLNAGTTLQHTALNTATGLSKIDITASDFIDLKSGSSINVSSRGYPGGTSLSSASTACGKYINFNCGTFSNSSMGNQSGMAGSYGGLGSAYNAVSFATSTKASRYGSYSDPLYHGMGSGTVDGGVFSTYGGGFVKLVSNNLILNGSILANGGDAVQAYTTTGSGGGVNINVISEISGSGTIEARGGNNINVSPNGAWGTMCGGGGRIAITALTNTSTLTLGANGGDAMNTFQGSTTLSDGTAGSIYKNINGVVTCTGGDCP